MMRLMIALMALVVLTACGVDGEPETPTKSKGPGISISITGGAEIGISG